MALRVLERSQSSLPLFVYIFFSVLILRTLPGGVIGNAGGSDPQDCRIVPCPGSQFGMTKKDILLLEKVFSAEIASALGQSFTHIFQSKSKRMEVLEQEGCVRRVTQTLPGRFPITISGWELTELGRMTYCFSVDDGEDDSTKTNTQP